MRKILQQKRKKKRGKQIERLLSKEKKELFKRIEKINDLVKEKKILSSIIRLIIKYNHRQAKAIAKFNNITHD